MKDDLTAAALLIAMGLVVGVVLALLGWAPLHVESAFAYGLGAFLGRRWLRDEFSRRRGT